MMTPEGREKAKVRAYLKEIGAYVFAPVQQGYGQQTLDILACVNGTFWGIEVKKEGGKLTARQRLCCNDIIKANGYVAWGTAETIIEAIKQENNWQFT